MVTTASATPADSHPLVLVLGCSELTGPLRDRDLQVSAARALRQLLTPKESLEARAIVINPSSLKDNPVGPTITELRRVWPLVDILVWSPRATGAFVREAMRSGAKDVLLMKSAEACAREVRRVVDAQQLLPRAPRLADGRTQESHFEKMVSRSPKMWDLFDLAERVAHADATVLILGETGTGKELLARALHKRSSRSGRFVAVNCGGMTEQLVDSELFGHVKGAFTGAIGDKDGLFRHADGGTLMLDEIGNIPLPAQYRLLRALQEGTVRPVGGHTELPVDVRVIAATSTSLEEDVERGLFREDLFYRLDVIRLEIPPLRQRPEDIIFLFAHFASEVAKQYNISRPDVRDDFLDALLDYAWPGNVRQLENFTERLVLTQTGRRVTASHFHRLLPFKGGIVNPRGKTPAVETVRDVRELPPIDLQRTLEQTLVPRMERVERDYLKACLHQTRGRIAEAADIAGISRRTLLRKLKQHRIDKARFRQSAE